MQTTLYYIVAFIVVIIFAATAFVTLGAVINKIKIRDGFLNILFTKLIIEVIAAFFFIFYAGPAPKVPPYTGEWSGKVFWTEEWAKTLMDPKNQNPNFAAINPRSEGWLYIYQTPSGVYRGFSQWTVKNGDETLAVAAVDADNFKFDASHKSLLSFDVRAFARRANGQSTYNGPSPNYTWRFVDSTSTQLSGSMTTEIHGVSVKVGTVELARN
jgi:hypothetical protein